MARFADLVQKAFYLGVGLASYAGEKATGKLTELQPQLQQLADEMVRRGEMTTEEARQWVEARMQEASSPPSASDAPPQEPRQIEILSGDDPNAPASTSNSENL